MTLHSCNSVRFNFIFCIASASLLVACGGEGSSGSTSSTYLTVNYFTNGLTYPPSGASYPSGYWAPISEAKEIVDERAILSPNQTSTTAILITYKDGGSNQISADTWNSGYVPPSPYVKNTTRYLQFNASYFISSPGQPAGTTTYVTTSDGYTWATLSTVHNAMINWSASSYPGTANAFEAGNYVTTPVAGSVKWTANYKAQNMLFYANQNNDSSQAQILRYFVKDAHGNIYIMHASGASSSTDQEANFKNSKLPPGWVKYAGYLPSNLVLTPALGANNAYEYNVFRDNLDSTYHQVHWGGHSPVEYIDGPMEIWGGNTSDTLYGAPGHDIYAAGGDDTINPGNGTHFIDGGTGIDTVVYVGAKPNYTITKLPNGQYAIGKPDGSTDTLNSVEILQFAGGEQVTIATSDSDTQSSSTATDWLKNLAQTVIWF